MKEPTGVENAALGPLPYGVGGPASFMARRQFISSLKLYDVTLRPDSNRYVFSFKVRGRFDRWGADITRMNQRRRRRESEKIVTADLRDEPITPRYPVRGVWNGLGKNQRRVSHGDYAVFAMVWISSDDRGAWDYARPGEWLTIN